MVGVDSNNTVLHQRFTNLEKGFGEMVCYGMVRLNFPLAFKTVSLGCLKLRRGLDGCLDWSRARHALSIVL